LDTIKAQGKRTDLFDEIEALSNPHGFEKNGSSAQTVRKLESREITAEKYGLNRMSVSRYVRLGYLSQSLLGRVDSDEIPFIPAVSLSYLSPDEQTELDRLLSEAAYKVDMKKAESLREYSESKRLTPDKITQILSGELNRKPKPKTAPPLKLKAKIYQKYFEGGTPQSEMETVIDRALAEYFKRSVEKSVSDHRADE
jgi:ParB family chromosome partitioning protein